MPPRQRSGVRVGQVVCTQAALAMPLLASVGGVTGVCCATGLAILVIVACWLRVGQHWAYQWWALACGYRWRRRTLPPGADLLAWTLPGARIGSTVFADTPAATIVDGWGVVAVVALGDPTAVLVDPVTLPDPAKLAGLGRTDGPVVRVQMLVTGAAAPVAELGAVPAAASYQQLTQGRAIGSAQALLAIRVLSDGRHRDELVAALAAVLRRLPRLCPELSTTVLGADALAAALADLAEQDPHRPVVERWSSIRCGERHQASFALRLPPGPAADRLLPRLATLPVAGVTVSFAAQSDGVVLPVMVRLAANGPAALTAAISALTQLVRDHGGQLTSQDGAQRAALARTLPLAAADSRPPIRTSVQADDPTAPTLAALPTAGLVCGVDRHDQPVLVRLFRPEPTRVLLAGGVPTARLLVLRALALGAHIQICTSRPEAWDGFARAASPPGTPIEVNAVSPTTATARRPLLTVVDTGAISAPVAEGAWRTTMLIRDQLTSVDTGALARADLAVLPPLPAESATLAGTALGLGAAAPWLTRIRSDMVALVSRRTVRWAALSVTPTERQLAGVPDRS